MIYSIQGTISHKDKNSLIIETNGLGYQIFVIGSLFKKVKIGQTLKLFTYLSIKEETIELYGFEKQEELKYFKLLKTVSGIGSKSGMNILSLIHWPDLERAIVNENVSILTKISGIGAKIAQKIILELKGKIEETVSKASELENDDLVIDGLVNLGYTLAQAREATKQIPPDILEIKKRIKQALKILSNR